MTAIPNTAPNAGLAAAVNGRVAAEGRMIGAKAAMWRMGGVGLLAAGLGAAGLMGAYGYARVRDVTTTADQMAKEIKAALASGEIKLALDPASKVAIDAQNNVVKLDPNASVEAHGQVTLDPKATIKVTGNITASGGPGLPRPTPDQLRNDAQPQSRKQVTVGYTVFKTVSLPGGAQVDTGYKFDPDKPDYPQAQYCYYMKALEQGTFVRLSLADNGVYNYKGRAPAGLNPREMALNCVWFDGTPTSF